MLTTNYDCKRSTRNSQRLISDSIENSQKISLKNFKEGKALKEYFKKKKKKANYTLNFDESCVEKQNNYKLMFTNFLCLTQKPQKQQCPCFSKKPCPYVAKWVESNNFNFHRLTEPNSKNITQIIKDIDRTQNLYPSQMKQQLSLVLRESLITYSCVDPELGYVQGFNQIMGSIVSHALSVDKTLCIFDIIMRRRHFRYLYLDGFKQAKQFAKKVIKTLNKKCNNLYYHLCVTLGIDLIPFILGWIIPLFANIVSVNYMHLVIDGMIRGGLLYLHSLIVSLFVSLKNELMEIVCSEDIMVQLSVYSLKVKSIDWPAIVNFAMRLPLTKKQTGIYV